MLTFFRKLLRPKSCYRSLLQVFYIIGVLENVKSLIFFWVEVWGQPIKAVGQRCSLKEVFSIFLQNSQENSPWLQLYQKADCNIYSFYHYYLKHQIIEFFFWSFFCLFIDHLVIFCPTFQVITIMQILLCSFYFSLSLNKLPQLVFFF